MNAQLLKESNNEKIVAPIIRNLKPKLKKKLLLFRLEGIFQRIQKF